MRSSRTPSVATAKGNAAGTSTILRASDLQRIRSEITQPVSPTPSGSRASERDMQHARSKARVATWDNTLAAKHKQKKDAYLAKLANEEAQRVRLDQEEARIQEEQRTEAIERANMLRYYETDAVKNLHSGLHAAELIKEREDQVELKKQLKAFHKAQDDEWGARAERDAAAFHAENEAARQAARERALEDQRSRAEQVDLVRRQREEHAQRDREEGEILRQQAEQHAGDEARKREVQRQAERRLRKEVEQVDSYHQRLRAEERERERKEESKIEVYAAERDRIDRLRKDRAESVFKAKQDQRQQLIEDQSIRLEKTLAAEAHRLQLEEATRESQMVEREEREQRSKSENLRDIREHHELQKKRLAAQRMEEKRMDKEHLRIYKSQAEDYENTEKAKKARARADAQALADYNRQQALIQADGREWDRIDARTFVAEMDAKDVEDEARFQRYKEALVQETGAEGKPTLPLHLTQKRRLRN